MPRRPDGMTRSRTWTYLVASSIALLCGGAQAQPTQPPPAADRRVEYQIDTMRLSVPLRFHHPLDWGDPPKGDAFRPYPDKLAFVLMWPKLTDATDPESRRCIDQGGCRNVVDVTVQVREPLTEDRLKERRLAARPAVVGTLHGFEVSRQTVSGSSRFTVVYLKVVGPDMGDPEKVEGVCDGSWQGAVPGTLPEIERQIEGCRFYWYPTDKAEVFVATSAQGFFRWKELYARVSGLLREWRRVATR